MQTDDFLEDILNLEAKLANQGMDSLAALPLEVFLLTSWKNSLTAKQEKRRNKKNPFNF